MGKNKKILSVAVLSALCGTLAVGVSACSVDEPDTHTHSYTVWQYNETEHWKKCEDDDAKDFVDNHRFVDGKCECGYEEPAPALKYGSAEGQIHLIKDGQPVTDYSDVEVTLDVQGPVLTFDKQTGKITITGLVAGKDYRLKITKPDYVEYNRLISVEENQNLQIGGESGIVIRYDSVSMLYTVTNGAGYEVSLLNSEKQVIEKKTVSEDNTVEFTGLSTKQKYYMSISVYNVALPEKEVAVNQYGAATVDFGSHFTQGVMPPKVIEYSSKDDQVNRTITGVNIDGDFCFAAKFKVNTLETGLTKEVRFGFSVKYGNDDYAHTFLIEGGKWRMQQMESWAGRDLTPEQITALTGADSDGLIVAIHRNAVTGDVYLYYGTSEDNMVREATPWTQARDVQKRAITEFGIHLWGEEGNGVYTATVTPYGYGKSLAEVLGLEIPDDINIEANAIVKQYKAADSALPDGTKVSLSNELGNYTLTVAGGKVKGGLPAGEYTVNVDGYIGSTVTVTDDGVEGGRICVSKNFIGNNKVVDWVTHDYSQIGDGIVKANSNSVAFISDASFDGLEYTVTTKKGNSTGCEFVIIYFEDGAYLAISAAPASGNNNYRVENYPLALSDWAQGTFKTNLGANLGWGLVSEADGVEHYGSANCETTLGNKLNTGYDIKLVRSQNRILIYIDGNYVKTVELAEEYASKKCKFGMVVYDSVSGSGWKLDYNTDLTAAVTANTPENGELALSQQSFNIGDKVTVTLTPDEGYLIGSLVVGGKDVTSVITGGEYTFVVTDKNCDITATFAQKTEAEVNVAITGNKYGVSGNSIADGTEITLDGAALGTFKVAVENGRIVETLPIGEYTVKLEGYIDTNVTVTAEGIENAITLEYDFMVVAKSAGWLDANVEEANQGIIKAAGTSAAVVSRDTYKDVMLSLKTVKTNSNNKEFLAIGFSDGSFVAFSGGGKTDGNELRFEWCDNDNLGWNSIPEGYNWFNTNLNPATANKWQLLDGYGREMLSAANIKETFRTSYIDGTIKFTAVRKGNVFYAFANDELLGRMVLDEKYADMDCRLGLVVFDAVNSQATKWRYEYNTDSAAIADYLALNMAVTVNGQGTAAFDEGDYKLGDVALLTATPAAGYVLASVKVGGNYIPLNYEGDKLKVWLAGDVEVFFMEESAVMFDDASHKLDQYRASEGIYYTTGNGNTELYTKNTYGANIDVTATYKWPVGGGARFGVSFLFEDGNNARWDLCYNDDGNYVLQSVGDWGNISDITWGTVSTLNDAQKNKFASDGLTLKIERRGNVFTLYIDGVQVGTKTIADGYADDMVKVRLINSCQMQSVECSYTVNSVD